MLRVGGRQRSKRARSFLKTNVLDQDSTSTIKCYIVSSLIFRIENVSDLADARESFPFSTRPNYRHFLRAYQTSMFMESANDSPNAFTVGSEKLMLPRNERRYFTIRSITRYAARVRWGIRN